MLPMLEAMEREACAERARYAGIFARLADVVFASIVRGWVECGCGDATGWIKALREAAEMGSSRSVIADRFLKVTGTTPTRYLAKLRVAAQWISRDRVPIEMAAQRLGYGSHAAFSRALKRVIGHPPRAARVRD